MPHRIAIVEDDDLIRDMIRLHLEQEGFLAAGYSSAESFLEEKPIEGHDLVILDIVLPGLHGDSLLERLRAEGDRTPVLVLTVKNEIPFRLRAFDRGADDYVVKPFSLDELTARVRAILQRSLGERQIPAGGILEIAGFRVNTATRASESNVGDIILSEKEIRLLIYLSRRPRQDLSRADILEDVWGMGVAPTPRTVDNFILKFRKLYEKAPDKPSHFLSIRGRGYRYEP
jgi:two-component system alkaline phosphatase synthesis response regulator PhoP